MKKNIVLALWMLLVMLSLAFYVSGQVPARKLPTVKIDPLDARIRRLENKVSELEGRVSLLEHPSPKVIPIGR
jgi:peptidoglycan hydrolase CwlO-like protein